MKSYNFLLACLLSIYSFAATSPVAFSQEITLNSTESLESTETPVIKIPANSSIIVTSPSLIQFEAGKDRRSEVILHLAKSIQDSRGRIILPVGTRVLAMLESSDKKEVNFFAYGIVINNEAIPFQTSEQSLNTSKVRIKGRFEKASEISSGIAPLGAVLSIADDNFNSTTFTRNLMSIHSVGYAIGLLSPESKYILEIAPNREFLLTLNQDIVLAESLLTAQVEPEPTQYQFNFRTIAEYDRDIAAIIDAVDNKQISIAEAKEILQSAATYAKNNVFHFLYPSTEMRQKVSQRFNFVYEIDS